MYDHNYCVVDIGGSKILLLLIDSRGIVLFKEKINTPTPEEPSAIIEAIGSLLAKGKKESNLKTDIKLKGIGVCIAGFLDHKSGLVYQSPNLHWNRPVPFGDLLIKAFKCPVQIENDANAAVVGEVFYGAAKGHKDVIYVTISTGIGGGLFLNGRLYRGSSGFAGEIGHTKPFGKGRDCKCGGYDCLETWASGSAIARSAEVLWDKNEVEGNFISTRWVFEQAKEGNTLAQKIIDQAIDSTGRGLANLVNLFNPSCIVIGGGVAGGVNNYLDKVADRIRAYAIRPSVDITPLKILPAKLEPEAGVWGMYSLLNSRVEE